MGVMEIVMVMVIMGMVMVMVITRRVCVLTTMVKSCALRRGKTVVCEHLETALTLSAALNCWVLEVIAVCRRGVIAVCG